MLNLPAQVQEKIQAQRLHSLEDFPEEILLLPLLEHSPQFRAFYSVERPNIPHALRWVQDPDLPRGIDHAAVSRFVGSRETRYVQMRRVPLTREDAIHIAHELVHYLLFARGFPGLDCAFDDGIVTSLTSMLHDPLAFEILMDYGFEVRADFDQAMAVNVQILLEYDDAPPAGPQRLLWLFNHVGHLLEWQVFSEPHPHEYLVWFEDRYPGLALEARELFDFINTKGFDTPVKMRALLAALLRRYNLTHLKVN